MRCTQEAPRLVVGLDDIFVVIEVIKPELQGPDVEQAENEGVETHGVTGELRELADLVVEAMQDLGGRA